MVNQNFILLVHLIFHNSRGKEEKKTAIRVEITKPRPSILNSKQRRRKKEKANRVWYQFLLLLLFPPKKKVGNLPLSGKNQC